MALFGILLALAIKHLEASDLTKGYTFTPNDQVTSTKLNNLVDLASINSAFVTAQTATTSPLQGDSFVMYSTSALALRKCTLGNLIPLLFTDPNSSSNIVFNFTQGSVDPSNLLFSASSFTVSNFLNLSTAGAISNFLSLANTGGKTNFLGGLWTTPLAPPPTNLVLQSWSTNTDRLVEWSGESNKFLQVTPDALLTNWSPVTTMQSTDTFVFVQRATGQPHSVSLTNIQAQLSTSKYTTNNLTLGVPTVLDHFHGLPGQPQLVHWVIYNVTPELGYTNLDEIDCGSVLEASGTPIFIPGANATNVFLLMSSGFSMEVLPKNNPAGGIAPITTGNWRGKVTAIFFP